MGMRFSGANSDYFQCVFIPNIMHSRSSSLQTTAIGPGESGRTEAKYEFQVNTGRESQWKHARLARFKQNRDRCYRATSTQLI